MDTMTRVCESRRDITVKLFFIKNSVNKFVSDEY